jgi:hypothetical protein
MQPVSEKRLAELLDAQYQHGQITELEAAQILEEFRSKRKASTYALYAVIAAIVSALIAAGSLVVSIIALRH